MIDVCLRPYAQEVLDALPCVIDTAAAATEDSEYDIADGYGPGDTYLTYDLMSELTVLDTFRRDSRGGETFRHPSCIISLSVEDAASERCFDCAS